MKKIGTFVTILFFQLLSYSSFADNTTTSKGSFGSKDNCPSGLGICNVTTTTTTNSPITMNWQLNGDETILYLTITNDMLLETSEEIATNFRNGRFIMETSFTLPKNIADLLGASGEITIPMGDFFVTHGSDGYTVRFTLE